MKTKILILLVLTALLTSCSQIPFGSTSDAESSTDGSDIIIETSNDESSLDDASYVSGEVSDVSDTFDVSDTLSSDNSQHDDEFEYKIDITDYLQYINPENAEEYLVLVNYDRRLTGEYAPTDLVNSAYTRNDGRDKQKLRKTCEKALEAMMAEAKLDGVTNVSVTSAYRSFSYQKWLFAYYVDTYKHQFSTLEECENYVMTFSCREGCSEHQTGLAFDMHNLPSADQKFANTAEYKWLSENAHKFGFIVRFPKNKENITGISFEPWHFRFVGRQAATYIYEHDLCLEEYIELIEA